MGLEEERKYDELEGLQFIKALHRDKKFDEIISQFTSMTFEDVEKEKANFFLADSYYQLKKFKRAEEILRKGSRKKLSNRYHSLWGNVYFKLKDYKSCRSQFRMIPESKMLSEDWKILFSCLEKSNHQHESLSLALKDASSDPFFFLEAQKTLVKSELIETARMKRESYLETCRSSDFYLRLWEIIEKTKSKDLSVLEKGHACQTSAVEITSLLVKAFFEKGYYHSVAYLFDVMSAEDKLYVKHAGEFYKVAGRSTVADYFFLMTPEEDYLLSKSSLFLNQENYAALMTVPLRPDYIRKHQDLAYALAYSHFKYLALDSSMHFIQHKKSSREENLVKMINQCKEMDWKCRP
jgi:hypothetical protein